MNAMKKYLSVALVALMVLGLAACGGTIQKPDTAPTSATTDSASSDTDGNATEQPAPAKVVTVGLSMAATTMDPAHEYEGDAEMMLHSFTPHWLLPTTRTSPRFCPASLPGGRFPQTI